MVLPNPGLYLRVTSLDCCYTHTYVSLYLSVSKYGSWKSWFIFTYFESITSNYCCYTIPFICLKQWFFEILDCIHHLECTAATHLHTYPSYFCLKNKVRPFAAGDDDDDDDDDERLPPSLRDDDVDADDEEQDQDQDDDMDEFEPEQPDAEFEPPPSAVKAAAAAAAGGGAGSGGTGAGENGTAPVKKTRHRQRVSV